MEIVDSTLKPNLANRVKNNLTSFLKKTGVIAPTIVSKSKLVTVRSRSNSHEEQERDLAQM